MFPACGQGFTQPLWSDCSTAWKRHLPTLAQFQVILFRHSCLILFHSSSLTHKHTSLAVLQPRCDVLKQHVLQHVWSNLSHRPSLCLPANLSDEQACYLPFSQVFPLRWFLLSELLLSAVCVLNRKQLEATLLFGPTPSRII